VLSKLKGDLTILGIIFLLAGFGYQLLQLKNARIEVAETKQALSDERSRAAAKLADAQAEIRQAEQKINSSVLEVRRETNEKVLSLVAQRNDLLKRVRLAEARVATNALVPRTTADSGTRETPSGDNQPELLGSIGTKDVEEAGRADLIRNQLIACYKQYDSVFEALNTSGK